ncbi:MAG: DUF4129 domain-containing protein [Euryarchaeota archaeon]|nr:DUF4129 domain-containing protein [Euryarchaeota archaeon]
MADFRTGPVPLMFFLLAIAAMAGFVIELHSLQVPESRPGQGPGERGSGNGTGRGDPLVQTGGGGGGTGEASEGGTPGAAAGGGGGAGKNGTGGQQQPGAPIALPLVPVDSGPGGAGRAEGAEPDLGRTPAAGGRGGAGRLETESGGGGTGGDEGGVKIEVPEWAAWLMTVLVVGLLAAGVGRMLLTYLRTARRSRLKAADKALSKRPAVREEEEIIEELEMILDDGLATIEDAKDVRAAIVQSYARMVQALAARGILRQKSSTPGEFRRMWSGLLGAPSPPLEGLTSLFEEAVFSVHPMGEPHRARAREQLRAGLEEVRAWKGAAA